MRPDRGGACRLAASSSVGASMILFRAWYDNLVCSQRMIRPAIWLTGASARPVSMLTAMIWPRVSKCSPISKAPVATTATPDSASTAVLM